MNIEFHFTNVSDQAKGDIQDYATKRFQHLDTFLTSYPEDNKMLVVNITYFERHNAFEVNCNLKLGGKMIHHKEIKHLPQETIDLVEANLIRQAKKHIDHLRKNQRKEEVEVSEEGLLPEEETDVTYDNI